MDMLDEMVSGPTMVSESAEHSEARMVREERWEEIRRLYFQERHGVSRIARALDLDRKTVRRCLRQSTWQPYRREPASDTLLTMHADFLRERASAVHYSARILYQELRRDRGYEGSYETVKRFVAPLRELQSLAALTQTRFETEPGHQSQIDWGESLIDFRRTRRKVHFFVLTLGFSRRAFCSALLTGVQF
jgi:transposase